MAHDPDAQMMLAETVHTAFRKGCEGGSEVHDAITRLPEEAWSDALSWMLYALDFSGWQLVRKPAEKPD